MSENIVKISGKIVGINDTGNKVEVTVKTNSKTWKGELINEYPIVLFIRENINEARKFNVYDQVYIEGKMNTRAILTDEGRKYTQNILGTSITGRLDTIADEMINDVVLEGVVKNIYAPNDSVSVIRVGIEDEETGVISDYPTVVGYGNAAKYFKNQINLEDRVRIEAILQTPKGKNKEKPNIFSESIVCKNIAVL